MSPFTIAFEALLEIRSFGDFIDWFLWIPFYMELIVGFGIIGVLAVLYIFIVAIFVDKHY